MNEVNVKSVFDYFEDASSQETGVSIFTNNELDLQMHTVLNDDGSISVNAEDTAVGFGWTTVAKSGNEVVRWARMNKYSAECGFPHKWKKDDYVPESLFYMLAMKANDEKAQKFQRWIAIDVIPSIRKNGTYSMKKNQLSVGDAFRMLELINQMPNDRLPMVRAVLSSTGIDIPETPKENSSPTHATPRGRIEYTKRYTDMNGVGDFLKTFNPVNRPSAEVYEFYKMYCEEEGIEPTSKIMFSKIVNQYLGTVMSMMKVKGQAKRVFVKGGA